MTVWKSPAPRAGRHSGAPPSAGSARAIDNEPTVQPGPTRTVFVARSRTCSWRRDRPSRTPVAPGNGAASDSERYVPSGRMGWLAARAAWRWFARSRRDVQCRIAVAMGCVGAGSTAAQRSRMVARTARASSWSLGPMGVGAARATSSPDSAAVNAASKPAGSARAHATAVAASSSHSSRSSGSVGGSPSALSRSDAGRVTTGSGGAVMGAPGDGGRCRGWPATGRRRGTRRRWRPWRRGRRGGRRRRGG